MESNFIVLFGSALIIRAQLCVVAGVMSWKRWLVCTTVETLPCYFDCRTVFYQHCSNTMNNLHVMFYVNGLTRYVILPPIIIRANINFVLLLAQLFIQLVASTPGIGSTSKILSEEFNWNPTNIKHPSNPILTINFQHPIQSNLTPLNPNPSNIIQSLGM